ncbi:MAG: hypothetical protein J6T97_01200 [Bacteroidaceae bacterium]|nr:hypothetical protein [Bacteroidaceae bacterium]
MTANSTDIFYKHLRLDEVTVTGLTGTSLLSQTPSAISVADARTLRESSLWTILTDSNTWVCVTPDAILL